MLLPSFLSGGRRLFSTDGRGKIGPLIIVEMPDQPWTTSELLHNRETNFDLIEVTI